MSEPIAIPSVFDTFFDDAAIFPPGRAPLPRAIHDHLDRRTTSTGTTVGPLLLTLDKLDAAAALLPKFGHNPPLRVGLVVAAGEIDAALTAAERTRPWIEVTGLELKTEGGDPERIAAAGAALTDRFDVHIELPVPRIRAGALALLAGTNLRLKVRTGGLVAAAFPTVYEMVEVISAALDAHRPYKLTAGLHRAVRHTDQATGFPHHGFLNIAVATSEALSGADDRQLATVLAETDGRALAERFRSHGAQWRTMFESFGTCSITEPLSTLADLDLVPALTPERSS